MREELEKHILQTFKAINDHYSLNLVIESLENKGEVIKAFENTDKELLKFLQEYVMLFESYCFIKSDKTLMFKARDIWKMELDSIGAAIKTAREDVDKKMKSKRIS